MALIVSAATGNFNAGATWTGGVVPGVGDEARASTGHTITISANATCDEVSNAGTGTFILASGITLTANVTNKSSSASTCVQFTAASPASGSIIGNCTGGPVVNAAAAANTSTGTLNITGNCLATLQNSYGGTNNSTGTLNITGNCTGGGGSQQAHGANNNSTGTLNITGNCIGGTSPSGSGSFGCLNFSTGTLNITGNCTGGSGVSCAGVSNNSTGTTTITGNVVGGSGSSCTGVSNSSTGTVSIFGTATGGATATSAGVSNATTGFVYLTRAKGNSYGPGNTAGLAATVGAANAGLGVIEIQQLEYGLYGMSPTSGTGIRLKKANSNVAVFNYCDTAGSKTLIDATQNAAMPAATDVRSGVSYASGAATGSCAVPAAGSVALGVPVGAGFGTAVLTPEAVWGAATRTLTSASGPTAADNATAVWAAASRTITGGTVDTLTNAPTVPTPSEIASQVRSELSVELGRVDQSISSRLAAADYTAPTTPPTAAQIATAVEGSLLNEADGQAVLNAIVGAIGNTNLSEVSLVAAVRADLERSGGKLDSIPTSSAPSASAVAGAVRTELGVELGRLDASVSSRLAPSGTLATVTNLTNAPASVTPSDIWSHANRTLTSASGPTAAEIRQEMDTSSTKLANLDAAVSTRATPANVPTSDITAIKTRLDSINVDRVNNTATTNIVGTLLAQSQS